MPFEVHTDQITRSEVIWCRRGFQSYGRWQWRLEGCDPAVPEWGMISLPTIHTVLIRMDKVSTKIDCFTK